MKQPTGLTPPRWATRLLNWWGHPNTREEVEGDLLELYFHWTTTLGIRRANWRYCLSVLRLLRPFATPSPVPEYSAPFFFHPDMLSNYLKIAWRNLARNKVYSGINIGGLALGMAVAMLTSLWIWDELSFNTYHKNHDRIAQVMYTQTLNGKATTSEAVSLPLASKLRTDYGSAFKRMALVFPSFPHVMAVGDKQVSQPGVWVQPDLPDMLGFEMLAGRRDALKNPGTALLAQSLATALFGNANPMGKTIQLDNRMYLTVAGVFQDLPRNTTFHDTKLFLPWATAISNLTWVRDSEHSWATQHWRLFVELNGAADLTRLNAQIKAIAKPHQPENKPDVLLHPMDQWHLYGEFKNGQVAGGRIQLVWLFGLIGVLVLLLACINFMNLSTARSAKRAKEVGIRKAIGSQRIQLIAQFFGESMLVSLLAFLVALLITQVSLTFINQLTDKAMVIPWNNPSFWFIIVGFTLFTGLVAGSYPALYLSGFAPVKVLTGMLTVRRSVVSPRQVLVVVQFAVSIALIIGTVVVLRQLQHAKNRPVGYTRAGLITVQKNTPALFQTPYNALRTDLLQTGAVDDMYCSSGLPTETPVGNQNFDWKGKLPGAVVLLQTVGVTHDYGKTMGWQITTGRDFSRQFPSDTGAVILNQTAARRMGLANPVGETIRWDGKPHQIIGVVNDLVMESPYQSVQPCLFILDYAWDNFITVRLQPNMPLQQSLAQVAAVFKKYNPAAPFTYNFVDQEYARKFTDEARVGSLATLFAVVAILISCLGLFGLASFMTEQRTKEIGVRKVLGASTFSLWQLLSKEFALLVLVAFLLAAPIAWYILSDWLQHYAYRITLSWWIFALSGLLGVCIALLTVSFQSIRAALSNPVVSLRSE